MVVKFTNIRIKLNYSIFFSSTEIQVRFCAGDVEVITVKLEPHFNYEPRNSLIIYEFYIPHLEMTETRSNQLKPATLENETEVP